MKRAGEAKISTDEIEIFAHEAIHHFSCQPPKPDLHDHAPQQPVSFPMGSTAGLSMDASNFSPVKFIQCSPCGQYLLVLYVHDTAISVYDVKQLLLDTQSLKEGAIAGMVHYYPDRCGQIHLEECLCIEGAQNDKVPLVPSPSAVLDVQVCPFAFADAQIKILVMVDAGRRLYFVHAHSHGGTFSSCICALNLETSSRFTAMCWSERIDDQASFFLAREDGRVQLYTLPKMSVSDEKRLVLGPVESYACPMQGAYFRQLFCLDEESLLGILFEQGETMHQDEIETPVQILDLKAKRWAGYEDPTHARSYSMAGGASGQNEEHAGTEDAKENMDKSYRHYFVVGGLRNWGKIKQCLMLGCTESPEIGILGQLKESQDSQRENAKDDDGDASSEDSQAVYSSWRPWSLERDEYVPALPMNTDLDSILALPPTSVEDKKKKEHFGLAVTDDACAGDYFLDTTPVGMMLDTTNTTMGHRSKGTDSGDVDGEPGDSFASPLLWIYNNCGWLIPYQIKLWDARGPYPGLVKREVAMEAPRAEKGQDVNRWALTKGPSERKSQQEIATGESKKEKKATIEQEKRSDMAKKIQKDGEDTLDRNISSTATTAQADPQGQLVDSFENRELKRDMKELIEDVQSKMEKSIDEMRRMLSLEKDAGFLSSELRQAKALSSVLDADMVQVMGLVSLLLDCTTFRDEIQQSIAKQGSSDVLCMKHVGTATGSSGATLTPSDALTRTKLMKQYKALESTAYTQKIPPHMMAMMGLATTVSTSSAAPPLAIACAQWIRNMDASIQTLSAQLVRFKEEVAQKTSRFEKAADKPEAQETGYGIPREWKAQQFAKGGAKVPVKTQTLSRPKSSLDFGQQWMALLLDEDTFESKQKRHAAKYCPFGAREARLHSAFIMDEYEALTSGTDEEVTWVYAETKRPGHAEHSPRVSRKQEPSLAHPDKAKTDLSNLSTKLIQNTESEKTGETRSNMVAGAKDINALEIASSQRIAQKGRAETLSDKQPIVQPVGAQLNTLSSALVHMQPEPQCTAHMAMDVDKEAERPLSSTSSLSMSTLMEAVSEAPLKIEPDVAPNIFSTAEASPSSAPLTTMATTRDFYLQPSKLEWPTSSAPLFEPKGAPFGFNIRSSDASAGAAAMPVAATFSTDTLPPPSPFSFFSMKSVTAGSSDISAQPSFVFGHPASTFGQSAFSVNSAPPTATTDTPVFGQTSTIMASKALSSPFATSGASAKPTGGFAAFASTSVPSMLAGSALGPSTASPFANLVSTRTATADGAFISPGAPSSSSTTTPSKPPSFTQHRG